MKKVLSQDSEARGLAARSLPLEHCAHLPKPSRPYRLPEILSIGEVKAIIDAAAEPKYTVAFMLCYGSGLRTDEVIHLEPRHIDAERKVIRIERAKGNKDRVVLLPDLLLLKLRECWKKYRPKST